MLNSSYWHKGKRAIDKIKSNMLLDEGFKLIRGREEPLKEIYNTDVISKQSYNRKDLTNNILSRIMEMYDLDGLLVSKIKEYQAEEELQNKKAEKKLKNS